MAKEIKDYQYHTNNEFVTVVGRSRNNVKVPVVAYEGNSHQRRKIKRFLSKNRDLLPNNTIL